MEVPEKKSPTAWQGRSFVLISLTFSAIALAVCATLLLFAKAEGLRAQAIYWFFAALLAAALPFLRRAGPSFPRRTDGDSEATFEAIRQEIAEVERKVEALNRDLLNALEQMQEREEGAAEPQQAFREETASVWQERAEEGSDVQTLRMQELFSRDHLRKANLNLKQLKLMLKKLDLYDGPVDNTFDAQLPLALAALQKKEGIDIDGICGPNTLACLAKRVKIKPASRERPAP